MKNSRKHSKNNWWATGFLIIGSIVILFPVYIAIMVSFKNPQELAQSVLGIPHTFYWSNFPEAIKVTNYFHAFGNSFIITFFSVILTILTNSMVAYAVARNTHRRFFKLMFYYFLSAMFVPFPIVMLPLIREMSHINLANTTGLIVLYTVYGLSFNVFLYIGYLRSIPLELEEAALVDGASRWRIFWTIIFPLMTPMNATVGILTALWAWNDFMLPLVMLSKPGQYTLPLVQYSFQSTYDTNYTLAFASYLMALAPMVVIYLIFQKWIVKGVTQGAVK